MVSHKDRAQKAYEAMGRLGFPKKQVSPVLKHLYKLFENWEPIEDESYRILADTILDSQKNQPMPATSHHVTDQESEPHNSTSVTPDPDDQHPSAARYDMDVSDNETSLINRPMDVSENPQDALFLQEPKPEPEIDVPAAPVANDLNTGSSDCSGNCLLESHPCACARSTGGEIAYTPEGLVRAELIDECIAVNHFPEKDNKFYCKACPLEIYKTKPSPDPCKGHLARKFIKECWSKCGCGMQCGNRVIQRGITCNLQVFFTNEGKGWGLRTLDGLPKGAFICELVGEVLTSSELHERKAKNSKHVDQVLLDASWGSEGVLRDEEALCLDPTFYGNVGRFVNHRCYDANLVIIPVEVETPDRHYYHLALFTAKKIEAFEELTRDYGIDFDDTDDLNKAFDCMCGSKYCRGGPKNSRKRTRASASRN
ncbi:hypothetical protein ACQJBY_010902 [Aegilops geniculata]